MFLSTIVKINDVFCYNNINNNNNNNNDNNNTAIVGYHQLNRRLKKLKKEYN